MFSCIDICSIKIYQGYELAKPVDAYKLLEASAHKLDEKTGSLEAQNDTSNKWSSSYQKGGGYAFKKLKVQSIADSLRSLLSVDDILKLTDISKSILNRYVNPRVVFSFL